MPPKYPKRVFELFVYFAITGILQRAKGLFDQKWCRFCDGWPGHFARGQALDMPVFTPPQM